MVQKTAYDYIIRYPQKQNDAQFAIELGTGTPMWLPPSVGYDDVKGVESDNIQIFFARENVAVRFLHGTLTIRVYRNVHALDLIT